jgi:hypothetical protein
MKKTDLFVFGFCKYSVFNNSKTREDCILTFPYHEISVGRGYQPMARVHNPNDVGHRRFTAKENANKQMIRFHPCKHAVVAICNDTIEEMDTSE